MTTKFVSKSPRILQVRKDRNYDYVYVNKKKIMLGRSGTPEAQAAFLEVQAKLLADPTLSSLKPHQVAVDTLCLGYLEYVAQYDPSHFHGIKTAVEIFLKTFVGQPVESLDSRSFLLLQEMFIQRGVSRQRSAGSCYLYGRIIDSKYTLFITSSRSYFSFLAWSYSYKRNYYTCGHASDSQCTSNGFY